MLGARVAYHEGSGQTSVGGHPRFAAAKRFLVEPGTSLSGCCARRSGEATIKRSIIAFAAVFIVGRLAAQEYPPGLFENSPVIPSGPPGATAPSEPPDAGAPSEEAGGSGSDDDYCASVANRTFRNLAEVKRAHARCDRPGKPLPAPNDEGDK